MKIWKARFRNCLLKRLLQLQTMAENILEKWHIHRGELARFLQ